MNACLRLRCWFALAGVFVASSSQAQAIERSQLEQFRLSVESFTSRIQTLQMDYVLDWTADRGSASFRRVHSAILNTLNEKLAAEREPAKRALIAKMIKNHMPDGSTFSCKLSYAFPSIRIERTVVNMVGLDSEPKDVTIRAVDGRRFTGIDVGSERAVTLSRVSDKELRFFAHLPTVWLGLQSYPVQGPGTASLISLLSYPEVTTLQSHEGFGGVETIVLRVGPGLRRDSLPMNLGDGGYVKLWLAPSHGYLALRREFYVSSQMQLEDGKNVPTYTMEVGDFRPVPDKARRETTLHFPFKFTYRDAGGKSVATASNVTINGVLPTNEFRPQIPAEFIISVDGGPMMKLSGGTAAKRRLLKSAAETARDLLDTSPPPARNTYIPVFDLRLGGVAACLAALLTVYLFKRRSRHAAPYQ